MKEASFVSKVLNSRFPKEDAHGSFHMPVYNNVAFEFKTAEDLERAFTGKAPAHMYSRITNPTVEAFERKIRDVTGALDVVALSSGMAAIANLIMTVARAGDNIVTSKHLFGNTYSLFENTLEPWGLKTRYADLTDIESVEKLLDSRTKVLFFETITNPQLEVADIKALSELASSKKILLASDTTLTPPNMFCSSDHGVDIEVLSSTKYISGGATSVGGLIIDNGTYDWSKNEKFKDSARKFGSFAFIAKLRREVYRNIGACLSPHSAFLQSVGLETLELRTKASCENALRVARFLEKEEKVAKVNYPGLASSSYYDLALEQFGERPGSLLTFDLGSKEQCFKFMNRLRFIKRATNLQDNRTLMIHPASTIFCEYTEKLKEEMGVRETMIRLSVGIEDPEDLICDIKNALEEIK